MKKIISIIAILTGLVFVFTSCEDERDNPVLDTTQIQPPVINGPTGGDFVLLQENLENQLFTVEWSNADYVLDSGLVSPTYAVEFDVVGNDFGNPATLTTTRETSANVTVNRLNDICGVLGLPAEVEANLEMRIRSFYANAPAESLNVTSLPIQLSVTPFEFKVPPIYILGDGTEAGWENTAALEMENVEDATFAIVTTLGESGQNMKFISVLGQWAPQWGTDDNQTVEDGGVSGVLVYRPTEAVEDPAAIPVPETPGEYRVVADTTGLTYSAMPVTSAMSVIGDAVSTGWNASEAIEMEKIAKGKFRMVVTLDGTQGKAIQFVDDQNTVWGSAYPFVNASNSLVKTIAGKQSEKVINMPAKQGTFIIEVNLATNRFLIREQK